MRDEARRPLMAVVQADQPGESVEALEHSCAEELCEVAERWVSRLPATSSWRKTCVMLGAACSAFLGVRKLRQVRP